MRNAYNILVVKTEGKILLGRPRHRWKDNIRLDFREIEWMWTGCIWLRIRTSGGLF
jgi:hypothetical protein